MSNGCPDQPLSRCKIILTEQLMYLTRVLIMEELVEPGRQKTEFFLLNWRVQHEPLLLDGAINQHKDQVGREVSHREYLKMFEASFAGAWRGHDGSAMEHTSHERSG